MSEPVEDALSERTQDYIKDVLKNSLDEIAYK